MRYRFHVCGTDCRYARQIAGMGERFQVCASDFTIALQISPMHNRFHIAVYIGDLLADGSGIDEDYEGE